MLLRDIRYALRMFARSPAYVAMAVVALGLGIGANSVIFSFVSVYLLRPLPSVKDADRLTIISSVRRGNRSGTSYPDFLDWKRQNHVFENVTASQWANPILTGRGEPERVLGVLVSGGFFDIYTARPSNGRAFLESETAPGGERVAVISSGFWERHFGGRPDAVGQSLTLDGVGHKVVGIMPASFRFSWNQPDFWAPLTAEIFDAARGRRNLDVTARLKPGIAMATAQAEMDTIARRLEMQYPDTNAALRVSVTDLIGWIGEGPRESLKVLMGVVVFVLLIACANVANLQLARATGRTTEIAIRTAMGAGRARIVRQVLTESILVSAMGGLLGLALSYAAARVLLATIPAGYHPLNKDFVNGTALGFTAAIAILTGVLSGLAPAFQISRVNVNNTLKEGGRSGSGGARAGLRNAFVVTEISLAIVLLLAAGLLVKSFTRIQQVNPGFRIDNLLTANLWLPDAKYPKPQLRSTFFRGLVERAGAIPGVQSAAATTLLPMTGGGARSSFVIDGKPAPATGHDYMAGVRSVTPNYFQTIGTPLRRGRYFTEQDAEGALRVAIINERLARQFFPDEDPVGKRVKWNRDPQSSAPWMTIVGVAGDVKRWPADPESIPEMFAPLRQEPRPYMSLAIRTHSPDPSGVTAALRAELRRIDSDQPITNIRTLRSIVEENLAISKHVTILVAIFAGIALLMAAMGIYGVMSYAVAQRTRELGLRMALGAGSVNVLRLVLKQALWVIGIGVVIGVPGAAAVTRLLETFLYDVNARDPGIFVAVPFLLAAIALLASYIPARRATRVDPVVALRYQ